MRGSREKRWRRRVMRTWRLRALKKSSSPQRDRRMFWVGMMPPLEGQEDVLGGDDAAAAFA